MALVKRDQNRYRGIRHRWIVAHDLQMIEFFVVGPNGYFHGVFEGSKDGAKRGREWAEQRLGFEPYEVIPGFD